MHIPVLLQEVIRMLDPHPGDFVIDGTVDGGGHAAAILEKIAPSGRLLGLDWDGAMLADCERYLSGRGGVTLMRGNYADLPEILDGGKWGRANGLLLDLGFSSEQIMHSGRGFSFGEASRNEPLLMTYGDARVPVRDLLAVISEKELVDVLSGLGGERYARQIARALVLRRRKGKMMTSGDLADTVRAAVPKNYERGRIDPATRTFQALRIAANGELENLEKVLGSLEKILSPGGRAVIISFHSLEDGIVKRVFRKMAKESRGELLVKKPITASRAEIAANPRSRSAKLRGIRMGTGTSH
jgi:16S rRNA (cytosine1402-N4)-methyltransferase